MSRRIPISTTSQSNQLPNNAAANNRTNQNNNKNWQTSSLDLVFSFSRSQAFFGSNLPSSPSFVARYRRPNNINGGGGGGGGDEEEESQTTTTDREELLSRGEGGDYEEGETRTGSEDRGDESVTTTTTDEGSWSDDEEEEQRGLEGGEGRDDLLWEHQLQQEVLPRNAVVSGGSGTGSGNGTRGRLRREESNDSNNNIPVAGGSGSGEYNYKNQSQPLSSNSNYPQSPPPPASTERTHLLPASSTSYSPPSFQSFPSPSSTPQQIRDRRPSIISSEFWTEQLEVTRGKSTYGQTLFNTINVLVGVGLLALPLSFAEAGWALGSIMLLFCAVITNYTAKILARIMARDDSLETYSDVLVKAFGPSARTLIHSMFVFELGAFGIALIVLFSDSMSTLFPVWDPTSFKLLAFIIILPTTFLPLRFLSMTSLIGILSSFTLLFVLIADGTIKKEAPGSLWDPAMTSLGPRWMRLPLSFGLFMSGFSGHAVIPSLVRDMKDPRQFDSMINVAYIIAVGISFIMGAVGYIMFGNNVSSEITRDMLLNTGFPDALNKVAMWMIAINPVVKYALISRALSSTLEHLLGIHPSSSIALSTLAARNPSSLSIQSQGQDPTSDDNSAIHSEDSSSSVSPLNPFVPPQSRTSPGASLSPHPHQNQKSKKHHNQNITATTPTGKSLVNHLISPILLALIILLAILIPDFGRVLSFLGSASAFLICCIGPLVALLILGKKDDGSTKLNSLSNGRNRGGEEESLLGVGNNYSRGRRPGRKHLLGLKGKGGSGGDEDVWIVGSLERGIGWVLLIISIGFCLVGTVWTFLPLDVGLS